MDTPTTILKLLVYASDGNLRRRLLAALNTQTPRCFLETVADLRTLKDRLRRSCGGDTWLLLVSTSVAELDRITAIGELIQDARSILILPDQHRETVFAGHSLYPRFISYLDNDFRDVCSVLATVIHKMDANCC